MPTYVLLLQYTDEGIRNVRYLGEHIRAFRQAVEDAGGHLPHIYLTLGSYDFVAILEAPSDQDSASITLSLSSVGNFRTISLKAFGEDELDAISRKVPSLEDEMSRILRGFT